MNLRRLVFCAALSLAVASSAQTKVNPEEDRVARVHLYVHSFNERDVVMMGTMVTDDVEWLNIDGQKVSIASSGKAALLDGLKKYFASCPSCKSKLKTSTAAGSRVTALEIAEWDTAKGHRMQQSLSVYEFRDKLIRRVYYFPVDTTGPVPGS